MKSTKNSSRGKLVLAVLGLGLGVVVCGRSILQELGGPRPSNSVTATSPGASIDAAAPPDAQHSEHVAGVDTIGDLVAVVGSFVRGTAVPSAFVAHEAMDLPPAAPGGEIALPRSGWTGAVPPQLHVTFVMLGGDLARACVDSQVVGVGSTIGGGVVHAIERDGIVLQVEQRLLSYDFGSPWPLEFRAEAARRAAASAPQSSNGESK